MYKIATMRYWTILLIFFCITTIQAQSKFSFGISADYSANYRLITRYESKLYKEHRDSEETFLQGNSVKATLSYRFSGKFSIETGFVFSKNGYSVKEVRLIDPGFSPVTTGFTSELYQYSNRIWSIPFHIAYSTKKRVSAEITAGYSFVFRSSGDVERILRCEYGISDGQKKIVRTNESDVPKVNLSLDLGSGVGYRLTQKLKVILKPEISYELIGSENSDIRDRLYNLIIFINENKSTREHLVSYGLSLNVLYNL